MPDADALLQHAGFLRGLARSLLLDDHQADDAVQQTLLAALENPPARPGNLRAWLTGVLKNVARMRRRTDGRRAAREKRASRPEETVPSASEVAARLEMQRRVVEAVSELAEPYRSVVVFRYFDELRPEEIARRLAVPVETVKTRLKRARARMRERFDRECGGRAAWSAVLLPLALPPFAAPVSGGTAAAAGLLGLLGMKTILAVSTALVVGVALFLFGPFAAKAPRPERDLGDRIAVTEPPPPAPDARTADAAPDATPPPPQDAAPVRLVVRDDDGAAIPGAVVEPEGGGPAVQANADGLAVAATAAPAVRVHAKGFVARVVPLHRAGEQTVTLTRGAPVTVTVTDPGGRPVAGAAVRGHGGETIVYRNDYIARQFRHFSDGTTDADGVAALDAVVPGPVWIVVDHESFARATVQATVRGLAPVALAVQLRHGATVRGRVVDGDGEPLADARVGAVGDPIRKVRTDARGRYELTRMRTGVGLVIHAWREGYASGSFGARLGWGKPVEITLGDGETVEDVDITLVPGVVVRGRVVDGEGEPLADVGVQARMFEVLYVGSVGGLPDWAEVATDEEGRFTLGPFAKDDSRLLLSFRAPRHALEIRDVQLAGADVDLGDLVAVGPGRVRGRVAGVPPGAMGRVRVYAESGFGRVESAAPRADGTFELAAGPGATTIRAETIGEPPLLSEKVTREVAAGEVADGLVLRLVRRGAVRGRVVDHRGHPRRFIRVGLVRSDRPDPFRAVRQTMTGDDGRFAFERLVEGEYRAGLFPLDAWVSDRFVDDPAPVACEIGDEDMLLRLPKHLITVTGRALGRDGRVLPDFEVTLIEYKLIVPVNMSTTGVTNDEGRFSVTTSKPGRYAIEVGADGLAPHRTEVMTFEPGQTVELGDVRLGAGGRVHGVLRDHAGRAVPWAQVHLLNARLQTVDDPPFSDAQGRYEVGGLAPGVYTLFAVSPRHPLGIVRGIAIEEGGAKERDVTFDPAAPLTLRVVDAESGDPVPGAELTYSFAALQPFHSGHVADYEPPGYGANTAGPDGVIRKPYLPAGPVVLVVKADGYAPAQQTVVLEPGAGLETEIALAKE